jgi:hypothetical protein
VFDRLEGVVSFGIVLGCRWNWCTGFEGSNYESWFMEFLGMAYGLGLVRYGINGLLETEKDWRVGFRYEIDDREC